MINSTLWQMEASNEIAIMATDDKVMKIAGEETVPEPTMRERRWVKVGWPSKSLSSAADGEGKFWIVEYDIGMPDIIDDDDVVPWEVGQLILARDMNEKCEILKKMKGVRVFSSLSEYQGHAFLKAWEEK